MHRCVLGKDALHLFLIETKQFTRCSGCFTGDLQTEPKKVLCVGVVIQMQIVLFIQTNNFLQDPYVYMHPPTPPSSLPPSPTGEPLASLGGEVLLNQHVKIPDSLPTPPHQVCEMPDEFPSAR